MSKTHLAIQVFLVVSSSADATLAVAAEQGLELVLVHLHDDGGESEEDGDGGGDELNFFTSADFDLLLPSANVQGCGAQTLHSELLPEGPDAFTLLPLLLTSSWAFESVSHTSQLMKPISPGQGISYQHQSSRVDFLV